MRRSTIAAALFIAGYASSGTFAQGLQQEGAIDAIVGSEVSEHESSSVADHDQLVEAIDKAGKTAETVRKVTDVSGIEIVFLSDAASSEGGPPPDIAEKLKEREREIEQLRQEIEGNALLYHAINSRQILIRDVLALSIGDDRKVMVYAAAKPAG